MMRKSEEKGGDDEEEEGKGGQRERQQQAASDDTTWLPELPLHNRLPQTTSESFEEVNFLRRPHKTTDM